MAWHFAISFIINKTLNKIIIKMLYIIIAFAQAGLSLENVSQDALMSLANMFTCKSKTLQ